MKKKTQTADKDSSLQAVRFKKNAFRSYAPAAYRPAFVKQVEYNLISLVLGDVDGTSMVRPHKRSLTYQLRIGFGKRNHYVRNDHRPQEEYLDYAIPTRDGLQ